MIETRRHIRYIPVFAVPAVWPVWESASGSEAFEVVIISMLVLMLVLGLWAVVEMISYFWKFSLTRHVRIGFAFLLTLLLSIPITSWPLRLAFTVWRSPLEELCSRVERGEVVQTPLRVGTFRIVKTEIRYGAYPALTLADNPSGPTSLIRTNNRPGNAWSVVSLPAGWSLYAED